MATLAELLRGIELPEEAKLLIADADAVIAKGRENASYIQYLEAENKNLRSKLGLPEASQGLNFDESTGTHVEPSSGLHYCTN